MAGSGGVELRLLADVGVVERVVVVELRVDAGVTVRAVLTGFALEELPWSRFIPSPGMTPVTPN